MRNARPTRTIGAHRPAAHERNARRDSAHLDAPVTWFQRPPFLAARRHRCVRISAAPGFRRNMPPPRRRKVARSPATLRPILIPILQAPILQMFDVRQKRRDAGKKTARCPSIRRGPLDDVLDSSVRRLRIALLPLARCR